MSRYRPRTKKVQHAPVFATQELEDIGESGSDSENAQAPQDEATSIGKRKRAAEGLEDIYAKHELSKPKKTRDTYKQPTEEWNLWCEQYQPDKESSDKQKYWVTPEKAALFINEWVVGRPVKRKGGKKAAKLVGPPEPAREGERTIGHRSLARYVECLVRIWDRQQRSEGNTAAHPRDGPIKNIIDTVKRNSATQRRDNFSDKLVGTYVDGLTNADLLQAMGDYGFQRNSPEGLRDRAMVLLSHYGMLRSGNLCSLEMSDCYSEAIEGEGPTVCDGFFFVKRPKVSGNKVRLGLRIG